MALPGQIRRLSTHEVHQCEQCLGDDKIVDASHSLCTEADSMGAEYSYLCEAHIAEVRSKKSEDQIGFCQFCNTDGLKVAPFRDPSEGQNGPVYQSCSPCRKRIIDDFCGED